LETNIVLIKKIPKNMQRLFFSNVICGFRCWFISIFTRRRRLLHI